MVKLVNVLDSLPNYEYVTVSQDMPIKDLKKIVREHPGVRSIYVTDKEGRVLGELSIGALIKNISAKRRCSSRISTRELLSCLTCKSASDIVDRRLVYASPDEDIERVLDRALKYNIKEMPVVDESGKLLKNISVLDLLAVLDDKD